jgi:hypothetical protein
MWGGLQLTASLLWWSLFVRTSSTQPFLYHFRWGLLGTTPSPILPDHYPLWFLCTLPTSLLTSFQLAYANQFPARTERYQRAWTKLARPYMHIRTQTSHFICQWRTDKDKSLSRCCGLNVFFCLPHVYRLKFHPNMMLLWGAFEMQQGMWESIKVMSFLSKELM